MDLPLLKNLTKSDLDGKQVLLRLDFNTVIKDGKVSNEYRIKKSLPTLLFLKERGARIVILSHDSNRAQSLEPIAHYLKKVTKTCFVSQIFTTDSNEKNDEVILFENLRFHKEEEDNDISFARKLAECGDIYINDAFSVSHRSHASIVSLPKMLPGYAGLLFEEEIKNLSTTFDPPHPFLFILGGGKVRSKFHLIEKFIPIADTIFVGGALANYFFKEMGLEIGKSYYEDVKSNIDKLIDNNKIIIPEDLMVKNDDGTFKRERNSISTNDIILDVGEKTLALLAEQIKISKLIVWNGPIGDYLIPGFDKGTIEMTKMIKESDARSIAGGGDTVSLLTDAGLFNVFDFVSTGGGAMLEFLSERTLPGIEALKK